MPLNDDLRQDIARNTTDAVLQAWSLWKPKDGLTVSEWCDRYRRLPREYAARPGRWDTSVFEPMRFIMDSIGKGEYNDYWIKAGSQIGKSEMLTNLILWHIANGPGPMIMIHPREDDASDWIDERLNPSIREMPDIGKLMTGEKRGRKRFLGGFLKTAHAASEASLAGDTAFLTLADEVDKYPMTTGKGGDPCGQIRARSRTYGTNAKRVWCSTPTMPWDEATESGSRIEVGFRSGTMHRWTIPCTSCGVAEPLYFEDLRWNKNDPSIVWWACRHCQATVPDYDRERWIKTGSWQAENPTANAASFHIWSGLTPWQSWSELAEQFLASKNSSNQLRNFYNLELGEVYEAKGESLDATELAAREPLTKYDQNLLPADALILIATVDTQDDRLEVYIGAWGLNERHWGVQHTVIKGDPADKRKDVFGQLWTLCSQEWLCKDGRTLKVSAIGIDSGGHRTDEVYRFCRQHPRKAYCLKGDNKPNGPISGNTTNPDKVRGIARPRLWWIGVNAAKDLLAKRLQITDPDSDGYIEFHSGFTDRWYSGLASEKRQRRMYYGRVINSWVQAKNYNEPWDLMVYQVGMIRIHRINWQALAARAHSDRQQVGPEAVKLAKKLQAAKASVSRSAETPTDAQQPQQRRIPLSRLSVAARRKRSRQLMR